MKTKLDTVYYDIQSDTSGLEAGVKLSEQRLQSLSKKGFTVKLGADGSALESTLRGAQRDLSATDRAVQQLTGGFKGLTLAAAAYKAAELAKDSIALADTYSTLEARLSLVTHGSADLAHVQKELFAIAQDAKQPLVSISDLYTRVSRSGEDLNASQADMIKFTDGVANSLRVSNTAAAQADGSLLQLSQALGGGVVHAEEFNSILEGTPRIAKAAADGFGATGISVSQLRNLVIAGKVSSKEFFEAFLKGSEEIKKEAAAMPETVAGAITKFDNAWLQYIGVANKANGTTKEIAAAINVLSENLDNLVQVAAAVGVVFGGRFLAGGVANVAAVVNEQLKLKAASIATAQATAQAATIEAAYAEDVLRSAAASKAVAEAEVAQAAARLEEVAATKAAITAEQKLQTARLQTAAAQQAQVVSAARPVDPRLAAELVAQSAAVTSSRIAEAEADLAAAKARQLDTVATLQAVEAERALRVAALDAANANQARAAGQLAQPGLTSLGGAVVAKQQEDLAKANALVSTSLAELSSLGVAQTGVNKTLAASAAEVAAAELRLAEATTAAAIASEQQAVAAANGAVSASMREIAQLGIAQSAQADRELVELAAAGKARGQLATAIVAEGEALKVVGVTGAAVVVAEKEVAVATSLMSTTMKGAAAVARGFWAAIGGPIGAILIGLYAVYSIMKKIESDALAKAEARYQSVQKEVGEYAKSLDKLTIAQLKTAEAAERATLAQKGQLAADLAQKIAKFRDTGADRNEETGGPAKLKKMNEELQAAVDGVLVSQGRIGAVMTAQEPAAARALTSITDKTAKAAESFAELLRNTRQYADTLGDVKNPLQGVNDKIEDFIHDANKYIATLSGLKKAVAIAQRDTILDQLAAGFDKLAATDISKVNQQIEELQAGLIKSATGAVIEQTRKQVQSIKDLAAARREDAKSALEAGNTNKAQTAEAQAKVLDGLVESYQNAGDELADLTDHQTRYEAALVTVTEAQQASDAAYQGTVPTLEQLRAANAALADAEAYLLARTNDTTLSTEEHTKAVTDLIRVRSALQGVPLENTLPVQDSQLLAVGLTAASNAAAQLGQNLGKSGDKLSQLAAAGIKLAGIMKAASTLQDVNKAGSGASSAQKLGAKTDVIALVVGGVVELAGALDLFGSKAKEQADTLRKAAVEFNRALDDFAIVDRTDLEDKLRANIKRAEDLAGTASKTVGFDTGAHSFTSSADIQQQIDDLRAYAAAIEKTNSKHSAEAAAKIYDFADALQVVADETVKNEVAIRAAHDKQVQRNTQDLRVRALAASGDAEGAEALRKKYERELEMDEALKDTTDSGRAYVVTLQGIQTAETAAAEATRKKANAARILGDDITFLGLKGQEALSATVKSLAGQFGEIKAAVDGLDLSTQDGIDALKQRGTDLYNAFKADGVITDAEQEILDGLHTIYSAAVDTFDSLAERVTRSMNKLADDTDIFGADAKTQFGGTVKAATGFNAVLDQILGSVDISSSAGAQAFRVQLQTLYTNLLQDGLTDEEAVIVGLIKTLLKGLDAAIDEGVQQAEAASTAAAAARTAKRSVGTRYNAVNDVEGADAFVNILTTLPAAISNMFGEFNLRTEEGVAGAKVKLASFLQTIEGMTDAQVIAMFGLPKNEVLDFILDLDSGLDTLAGGLHAVADAATAAASAAKDFTDSVEDDYLRASGHDQEADINASKAKTNKKLDTAKSLGVSQAEIDKIIETGDLDIKNINQRYADQAASAVDRATVSGASSASASASDEQRNFSATSVTSMTSVQGLRLIDVSMSQLAVLRDIYGAMLSRPILSPMTPALPQGVGGFGNTNTSGNGGISIVINLNGPITGQTAGDAAKQLANELLPYLDRGLGRNLIDASRISGNLR